jgi:hypothetical protein
MTTNRSVIVTGVSQSMSAATGHSFLRKAKVVAADIYCVIAAVLYVDGGSRGGTW